MSAIVGEVVTEPLREHGPPAPPIMAVQRCRTNAELIERIAPLFLPVDLHVLDPTYGNGKTAGGWWKRYRPPLFTYHDLDPAFGGIDFRAMPHADGAFPRIAWDPAYVAPGGRDTSTIQDTHQRFGQHDCPANPRALHEELIVPGLAEIWRVCAPDGLVLAKCQAYITGGRLQRADEWLAEAAEAIGFEIEGEIVHHSGVRPQPAWNRDGTLRRQVHERRDYSTLWVLHKPRPRRARSTQDTLL